ncbi:unnamed protein product [Cylicocyclus nassatus]|uniref:Ankyrin repeat and FYVE domain-containing protein 1 n=1 Tax=Cylicocyclus nassatus TaxID=53992 RepID=A0AA36GLF6_CYLNA|nr:unnamed protein product [Cylicocyclus nassatus]
MGSLNQVDLLREEHLKLQTKYEQLQQQYAFLQAKVDPGQCPEAGSLAGELFVTMRTLFEHHTFSDIVIRIGNRELRCHKFLLTTRSSHWNDLENVGHITIPDVNYEAFELVYRWMYTDVLPRSNVSQELLREVCHIAFRYHFKGLQSRCVQHLKARVDVSSCISLYEFADTEDIGDLRDYCGAIIAAHWNEFVPQQFAHLSAPSLYQLLKRNSHHILHSIVQLNREDVLLLYFIENDSKVPILVNALDQSGLSPLEIALSSGHINMANQLLSKNASCNVIDGLGKSILVRMIEKGDALACEFLASAGADLAFVHEKTRSNLLHFIAVSPLNQAAMAEWAESRLREMSMDAPDYKNRTAVLLSIASGNFPLANTLIVNGADLVKSDVDGRSPLSVALFERNDLDLAATIVGHGATSVVNHRIDKESLLHIAVNRDNFDIAKFLLENGANVDVEDKNGASPLEVAVRQNNAGMASLLLEHCASVDISQQRKDSMLHTAVSKGAQMIKVFAEKAKGIDWTASKVLEYALDEKALDCAKIIIGAGAQIEERNLDDNTLLIQRILLSDDAGARFLIEQGANHLARDSNGRSCFELAATFGLLDTLRVICGLGVNINERTDGGLGYTVLERALTEGHYDCAKMLVSLGCDVESVTADNSYIQSVLHHFIDACDEKAAIFLVQNGCNGNATRVSRDPGEGREEPALHRAVSSGMNKLVAALVTSKVNLVPQDAQGRTACHVAVQEKNAEALAELLRAADVSFLSIRDKIGQTPFSLAVVMKEYSLAAAIVRRQPHVALQTNGSGENLLHTMVKTNDLEGVLFLLSTHTDATRVTIDGSRQSALHYAANVDNELIMRNLILAGCDVGAKAADGNTALHVAVRADRACHAEILLENGADPNVVDDRGENALLCAVRSGSINCVKVLTANASVDGLSTNKNSQTALHLCSTLTAEKVRLKSSPADICDLLLRREANRLLEKEFGAYVDQRDADGNTALLLAYMAGNGDVCRCLLRAGATMGARNADGATMFTYETPTRLLLFRLLDSLEREPRWSDGDVCDCGVRFSITVRKHHCRHCGRLVCAKCSEVTMPIAKFGEEKRVRVCSLCAEVLTTGGIR